VSYVRTNNGHRHREMTIRASRLRTNCASGGSPKLGLPTISKHPDTMGNAVHSR
jgi:hypothetical protein